MGKTTSLYFSGLSVPNIMRYKYQKETCLPMPRIHNWYLIFFIIAVNILQENKLKRLNFTFWICNFEKGKYKFT